MCFENNSPQFFLLYLFVSHYDNFAVEYSCTIKGY